jgi:hypothetical protein
VNWPSVRLAELSKVITKGTTPTSIGFEFSNDGVRFLRVQNIEGGTINYERDTLFIDESTHQPLSDLKSNRAISWFQSRGPSDGQALSQRIRLL